MIHCSMIFCQRINISNYICRHTELLKNPPFNANTTAEIFPFRPLMGRASGKNLYKNVLVAVRAVCYDGF